MNGEEFYEFLRSIYNQNGQPLYGNFTFCDWLPNNQTFSFRFNIANNNPKSISANIIINAWNANHIINDEWLLENFGVSFHRDCRLYVLNYLIQSYNHLR